MSIINKEVKSGEEESALQKFRRRTEDLKLDDMTLLRFLRARELDWDQAEDMLRASIEWRASEIDTLAAWEPPTEIRDGFDVYQCGFDYEGRPVLYAPLGMWASARDLTAKGLGDEIFKHATKMMDKMVHENLLKTTHQNFVYIVDATGATYRRAFYELQNLRGIQDLMQLVRDYEANYPETLYKSFIVNTPGAFYYGWNLTKPLMTKHTISKIQIFDDDQTKIQEALHGLLPLECIPEKFGGLAKLKPFY